MRTSDGPLLHACDPHAISAQCGDCLYHGLISVNNRGRAGHVGIGRILDSRPGPDGIIAPTVRITCRHRHFRSFLLPVVLTMLQGTLGCGASAPNKRPTGTRSSSVAITVNTDVAEAVLTSLETGAPPPHELLANPGLRALIAHNQQLNPQLTGTQFLDTLAACSSGCAEVAGLSLQQAAARPLRLRSFLSQLDATRIDFQWRLSQRLSTHIPLADFPFEASIYVVLGGRDEAYLQQLDGQVVVVVELSSVTQQSDAESWTRIRAAAERALWQQLFLAYVHHHWLQPDPLAVDSLDYQLIFTMLSEGYGHYLALMASTDDDSQKVFETLTRHGMAPDRTGFLDLFPAKTVEYLSSERLHKQELLTEAHHGELWHQWGALTGAFVIARLTRELGRDRVLALIAKDPVQLWRVYATTYPDDRRVSAALLPLLDRADAAISPSP